MPNNKLPFGLCKNRGISLPEKATPRDAWNALKEHGITPDSAEHFLRKPFYAPQNASYKEISGMLRERDIADSNTAKAKRPSVRRIAPQIYEFPVGFKIKLGKANFIFKSDIRVTDVITIVPPRRLKNQTRLSGNDGEHGRWRKKGGNAVVEVSGVTRKAQIHWYENADGSINGAKLILKRKQNEG